LIAAGLRLAEQTGLGGLSVNLLVQEAGVSKGTFFHHFRDRATYLLALHSGFHDRIREEMTVVVAGVAPGVDRLLAVSETYLDACLRDRGVRALLLEARAEMVVVDAVRARNVENAELCEPDFAAMGWRHPMDSARLWVGMVAEAALIELDAGEALASTRDALREFATR
jgi:AcrR family transcriptional regulator